MKYPQLVSSRAVSEISDWLIRRLEDLDIEQPSVYSRLLLSILHTPFKVNAIDLLEIPQLKVTNYFYRSLTSPHRPPEPLNENTHKDTRAGESAPKVIM